MAHLNLLNLNIIRKKQVLLNFLPTLPAAGTAWHSTALSEVV